MSPADAQSLVAEARRLDGEARVHKRAIASHRRQLQQVRERQAELERRCLGLGILVTYHPTPTGEGDHPWPRKHVPSSTSRP